jgi:ribonucleoside-diphosphate reductase alpha chain
MDARTLLGNLYTLVIGRPVADGEMRTLYPLRFPAYVTVGIAFGHLDRRLATFDLDRLAAALDSTRDLALGFIGAQMLVDRCLLQSDGALFELPQWFWMRVAMGLALAEPEADRTPRAIEFYHALSTMFNPSPKQKNCFETRVTEYQSAAVLTWE